MPWWIWRSRRLVETNSSVITRDRMLYLIELAEGANLEATEELCRLHRTGDLPYTDDEPELKRRVAVIRDEHHRRLEYKAAKAMLERLQPALHSPTLPVRLEALIAVHRLFLGLKWGPNFNELAANVMAFSGSSSAHDISQLALERYEELLAASQYDLHAFMELDELLHSQAWYDGLEDIIRMPALPPHWDELVALHDPNLANASFTVEYVFVWPRVLCDISRALRTNDLVLAARLLDSAGEDPYIWAEHPTGSSLLRLQIMADRIREMWIRQAAEEAAYAEVPHDEALTAEDETEATHSTTADPAPAVPAQSTD